MTQAQKNQDTKEDLRSLLLLQTRLLDSLIHSLMDPAIQRGSDEIETRDVIVLMIQGLGVSIHSILRLTETIDMGIRDCLGIARSASELAVNIAYIAASPGHVASKAKQHAMQKAYRDLARTSSAGGVHISLRSTNVPSSSSIPGMDAALAAFTDKKGREIRDWTADNIDKRIEIVGSLSNAASMSLSASIFAIYRHGSELLHGTYFGVVHYWTGSGSHDRDKLGFERLWLTEHFITVFTAAFFGASGVVEACAERFDIEPLGEAQKVLHVRVAAIIDRFSQAASACGPPAL